MSVRAKFVCRSKEHDTTSECGDVVLDAVISGSAENQEFFKHTPNGQIRLGILNPAAFAAFEPYYVDFTPAESPVAATGG